MTSDPDDLRDVAELIHQLCNGELTASGMARLDQYLAESDAAVRCYIEYLDSESQLLCQSSMILGLSDATTTNATPPDGSWDAIDFDVANDPDSTASTPVLVELAGALAAEKFVGSAGPNSTESISSDSNPSELSHSPVLDFLDATFHGTVGYSSSGWPVAYLVATVIFGVGLLIGTFTYVSHPLRNAEPSPSVRNGSPAFEPQMQFVGRITGMVDCQWADESTAVAGYAAVPLGRKYALASGLMEITYDTGAKVILQGPVTYEVESPVGGYLSVGKVTARVESTKYGVRSTESSSLANHPSSTSQSPIRNPSLSTTHSPLFTIKTPTAIVTDLGTEFGVEVDQQGVTTSQVFRGSVRVQAAADGTTAETGQVLHENESARVDARADRVGNDRITLLGLSANPVGFVREIPKRTTRMLDLVDVVAGGDGFSGRRNRGIDPTTGRAVGTLPTSPGFFLEDDGQYHRVEGMPFVDGVFVPDGRTGRVQIDSAGHVFTGFPNISAACQTSHYIWAGGAIPVDPRMEPIPTELNGVEYASPGHGLLFLHTNKGITFDLDAIRRANPGYKLGRFRAVAGDMHDQSLADLWVLVDGQVRFRRREINSDSGAISVMAPIDEGNRFLTLATTEGGDGIGYDWILFGDPRLELLPAIAPHRSDLQPKERQGKEDAEKTQ